MNTRLIDDDTFRRLSRSRDYLATVATSGKARLDNAAAAAHLSPFHYHRLFARAFGCTPHEFVTERRIEEAKRMLAREHDPVTEICLTVGYESLGSFSTWFRKNTGLSPAEYRRQSRRIFESARIVPVSLVPQCFLFHGEIRLP